MPPEQEALLPAQPGGGGLFKRVLGAFGDIDHAAWLRARAEHAVVGTCRNCPGDLHPQPPTDRGDTGHDYEAVCVVCGSILLAPRGRTMRGSTAWSKSNGAARAAALRRHHRQSNGEDTD